MSEIDKLLEVMRALRNKETGCPWDLEQDFSTIAPYTIEEAYEVAEAIEREDWPELEDELGDLLFQVVFYTQLATEKRYFDFDAVAKGITDKMIRRHPHVFGDVVERDSSGVRGRWEDIKAEERAAKGDSSALAGVARALPALKRAQKLGKRASRVGFDWPDRTGVREKILEELAELDAAVSSEGESAVKEELGDLLFAVVNLARHLDIDPEQALASANRKFEQRFRAMEAALASEKADIREQSLETLDEYWREAKKDVG